MVKEINLGPPIGNYKKPTRAEKANMKTEQWNILPEQMISEVWGQFTMLVSLINSKNFDEIKKATFKANVKLLRNFDDFIKTEYSRYDSSEVNKTVQTVKEQYAGLIAGLNACVKMLNIDYPDYFKKAKEITDLAQSYISQIRSEVEPND